MARNVKKPPKETPLYELLEALKGLKECEKDPREHLYNMIFYTLKIKNYEKIDTSKKEAFLIKVANKLFGKYTFDADTTLMILGLLEGYEHIFIKSGAKRGEKYLKESPFLVNSEGRNDASYDEADDELKVKYIDRLRKKEESLLLEMADFMITQSYHIEEFLEDIDDYIDGDAAIFPTPGYIKRKQARGWLDIILNYLIMGIKVSAGKGRATLNKNSEYEMNVPLPGKFTITVASSMIVLSLFSMDCILQYPPQKDNTHVVASDVIKHDYIGTSLAKQELPNID